MYVFEKMEKNYFLMYILKIYNRFITHKMKLLNKKNKSYFLNHNFNNFQSDFVNNVKLT
jgi:hypothetical protein